MENENLKREFTNEKTGISYTLVGDYYVPNKHLDEVQTTAQERVNLIIEQLIFN